ncbi:MAG: cysteine--tRNA ligase [Candidatus Taylorbacteria bacterium]|nr:cysteine--tRNA ligase [Candidatus Taylorbacteria bacterium]
MPSKNIYLINTLGRKKELFSPISNGNVGIYHCGPTVYWTQHIGNLRAVVLADTIRRTFEFAGYNVTFVRNYTDVGHLTGDNDGDADTGEDRMEKASKREQLNPDLIAQKYTLQFDADIAALNTLPSTVRPKATDHIDEMIDMVSTLLSDGYAYTTDYAVYFDVSKFEDYNKLSGQKLEMQEHGKGHGTAHDTNKRNPSDFALWIFKAGAYKDALQTWKSPFASPLVEDGIGFPGWHIECSAMSKKYLGNTFDVHIGGVEHISIHHTNEIAQSVCANHAPFATYWLHNEHLLVDNKKMSKSEGTSFTLEDITKKGYNPLSLRYFFLQAHYRSKQNFTFDGLEASDTAYRRLKNIISSLPESGTLIQSYVEEFEKYIYDDFNIPGALGVLWELTKDEQVSKADMRKTALHFDTVLGLSLEKTEMVTIPDDIKALLEERKTARMNKDWVTSDKIRDILLEKGYTVLDSGTEQTVLKK